MYTFHPFHVFMGPLIVLLLLKNTKQAKVDFPFRKKIKEKYLLHDHVYFSSK